MFTRENTKYIPTLDNVFNGAPLHDLSISQQMVENKLSKLKTNKSSGPDGFHSRVLKETASSIGLTLSILYNMSLIEGRVPLAWKEGNILQFTTKKAARQMQEMESIIRNHLVDHMAKNTLFCEAQHGLMSGRSCMTHLLITLQL